MAVELADLVDSAKVEVSAPGENFFPNATDDEWILRLENAFYAARLMGYFPQYKVNDNEQIVPVDGTTTADIPREMQQLIIFFTGYNAVKARLLTMTTATTYTAGPVTVDIERSANMLTALLKELRTKMDELTKLVLRPGRTTVAVLDAMFQADQALYYGDTYWAT